MGQCKSFDWFMKEIAYDLPKFFPLVEPTNGAKGHITNEGTGLCVDGKHGGQGNQLGLDKCDSAHEVNWMLTWHEDIRPIGSHAKKSGRCAKSLLGRDRYRKQHWFLGMSYPR